MSVPPATPADTFEEASARLLDWLRNVAALWLMRRLQPDVAKHYTPQHTPVVLAFSQVDAPLVSATFAVGWQVDAYIEGKRRGLPFVCSAKPRVLIGLTGVLMAWGDSVDSSMLVWVEPAETPPSFTRPSPNAEPLQLPEDSPVHNHHGPAVPWPSNLT